MWLSDSESALSFQRQHLPRARRFFMRNPWLPRVVEDQGARVLACCSGIKRGIPGTTRLPGHRWWPFWKVGWPLMNHKKNPRGPRSSWAMSWLGRSTCLHHFLWGRGLLFWFLLLEVTSGYITPFLRICVSQIHITWPCKGFPIARFSSRINLHNWETTGRPL